MSDCPRVPDLIESSGEESEEEEVEQEIQGNFPWEANQAPADLNEKLKRWEMLTDEYQSSVWQCSFILTTSPYLFMRQTWPVNWFSWAVQLKFFELNGVKFEDFDKVEAEHLPTASLRIEDLLVINMFSVAQGQIQTAAIASMENLKEITSLMNEVDGLGPDDLIRFIRTTRERIGDEIAKLVESVWRGALEFSDDIATDGSCKFIGTTLDEAMTFSRVMLVCMVTVKNFVTVVDQVVVEGRDRVKEVEKWFIETKQFRQLKEAGNKEFQKQNFPAALDSYTNSIKIFPYCPMLYSNRCQTAIKLKKSSLAISDGFRAISLKPTWAKAYYRHAEAFKLHGMYTYALAQSILGKNAANTTDREDFSKQQEELEKLRDKYFKTDAGKRELAKYANAPDLTPNEAFKSSLDKFVDEKWAQQLEQVEQEAEKEKSKTTGIPAAAAPATAAVSVEKEKKPPTKNKKKKKQENRPGSAAKNETDNKKTEAHAKPPAPVVPVVEQSPHKIKYDALATRATMDLEKRRFQDAIRGYEEARRMSDDIGMKLDLSEIDRFVLTYAHGEALLRTLSPIEIVRAIDIFARLTDGGNKGKRTAVDVTSHPMAFHAKARAHFLLNDFDLAEEPLNMGLQMCKRSGFGGVLCWPGTYDKDIEESDIKVCRERLDELKQQLKWRPRPLAVCQFSGCAKEFRRRQIYLNDVNFEGFIKVYCHWKCVTSFHYKCWSRFKSENNTKHTISDKDLLDSACFTDGCRGMICRFVKYNEINEIRNELESSTPHHARGAAESASSNDAAEKPEIFNLSKSERNLARRHRLMQEAKDRKRKRKQDLRQEEEDSSKHLEEERKKVQAEHAAHKSQVAYDRDISEAQVIIKHSFDEDQNANELKTGGKSKHKGKAHRKKKTSTSLTHLIGGDNYEIGDVERFLAGSAQTGGGAEFAMGDGMRQELDQSFEDLNEHTDGDLVRIIALYEHFEKIFEADGPFSIYDDNLLKQNYRLPPEMRTLVEKFGGIVEFLVKRDNTFIRQDSYIGLLSQCSAMEEMIEHSFKQAIAGAAQSVDSTSEDSSSIRSMPMDSLDTFASGGGGGASNGGSSTTTKATTAATRSEFAREFYISGAVPTHHLLADDGAGGATPAAVDERGDHATTSSSRPASSASSADVATSNASSSSSSFGFKNSAADDVIVLTSSVQEKPKTAAVTKSGDSSWFKPRGGASSDGVVERPRIDLSKPTFYGTREDVIDDFSPPPEPEDIVVVAQPEVVASSSKAAIPQQQTEASQVNGKAGTSASETQTGLPAASTAPASGDAKLVATLRSKIADLETQLKAKAEENARLCEQAVETRAHTAEQLSNSRDEIRQLKLAETRKREAMECDMKVLRDGKAAIEAKLTETKVKLSKAVSAEKEARVQLASKEKEHEKALKSAKDEKHKLHVDHQAALLELARVKEIVKNAELSALESQESYGSRTLMRAKHECERMVSEFEKLASRYAHHQPALAHIGTAISVWKNNVVSCQRLHEQARQKFAEYRDRIRQGMTIAEIQPDSFPSPPPPGPAFNQVTQQLHRILAQTDLSVAAAPSSAPPSAAVNDRDSPLTPAANHEEIAPNAEHHPQQLRQQQSHASQSPVHPSAGMRATPARPNQHAVDPSSSASSYHKQWKEAMEDMEAMKAAPQKAPPQQIQRQPYNHEVQQLQQPQAPLKPYERIILQLQKLFPSIQKKELALCLKEVRQSNNNSLTGISIEELVKRASLVIYRKGLARMSSPSTVSGVPAQSRPAPSAPVGTARASAAAAAAAAPWTSTTANNNNNHVPRSNATIEVGREDVCVICHDPLRDQDIQRLQCNHVFHKECLGKWLPRNRTCPTCRDFAIDEALYPTLGQATKRSA